MRVIEMMRGAAARETSGMDIGTQHGQGNLAEPCQKQALCVLECLVQNGIYGLLHQAAGGF